MNDIRWAAALCVAFSCFAPGYRAIADSFGSGSNAFDMEFVAIDDTSNPDDFSGNPSPAGAVDYRYRMAKFEVSRSMFEKANGEGNLGIALDDMSAYGGNGPDKPATFVTWFEAATFVNWLNTNTNHSPAYKFDLGGNFQLWSPGDPGYDANNLFRNSKAKYFLPSVDEWYKAAFYDPDSGAYYDYTTGSNTLPTLVAGGTAPGTVVNALPEPDGPAEIMNAGGLSPYGTMAQGGNVWEWMETEFDLSNDTTTSARIMRGGDWTKPFNPEYLTDSVQFPEGPFNSYNTAGFRVASTIPEPSSWLLLFIGACAIGLRSTRSTRCL